MESPFLDEWVASHAATTPDAPALQGGSTVLTYRDLADRVASLRAAMAASGVRPGDHVLISLTNSIAGVVAGLAAQALAAVPVEVSRDLAVSASRRIVQRTRPAAIVVETRDLQLWATALGEVGLQAAWVVPGPMAQIDHGATVGGRTPARLGIDGRLDEPGPDVPGHAADGAPVRDPDDTALVLFTSGSTGEPHGVIQSYRNIDANTRSIVSYLELTSADRALLTLPLHYCYGRSVLQTHLHVGGSVVLESRFAFPVVVMDALASERATGFAGVPLTFEILRRSVDVPSMRFEDLRYVTQAGGPMHEATIAWTRDAFAPASLFVMYGQTEATARLTYLPPARALEKAGSIGIPIPGVTLDLVDETGRPVGAGEIGEIVARGANITPGYLGEPEATSRILREGWLWTGDLATRDADGFLFLRGRSKEIIKVGGHRVSPVEIEQVIAAHPDVSDAAVLGASDPLLGEVPIAFVVPRDGVGTLTAETLRTYCRASLPAHAVPARFDFVDRLPRNEAGKLRRADLRSPDPVTD